MNFPNSFIETKNDASFLIRAKKKAIKNFSWKSSVSLQNVSSLAYWLYVFDRENEALEICDFLSKFQFAGDFNLWTWIEHSLALQSRLYRNKGKLNESQNCINRILSAGFVKTRLDGLFVEDRENNIKYSTEENDVRAIRELTFLLMIELCILIELGGLLKLQVNVLEKKFSATVHKLRKILKI